MSGWPAPRRNFSPWYQVVSRLMATEETDGLPEDPAGFESWSERFRSRLEATLAPWPDRVSLDVEVTEEESVDGYRRSRIVFDSETDMSVPAYLLVPEGRVTPGSAVLAGCSGRSGPTAQAGQR